MRARSIQWTEALSIIYPPHFQNSVEALFTVAPKENFFLTLDKVTDWKIQPSSVYVDYFIDNRGLVLQINDPTRR